MEIGTFFHQNYVCPFSPQTEKYTNMRHLIIITIIIIKCDD